MNALSDLTRPLLAPEILNSFDSLAQGRCSLEEFNRSMLEACDASPGAVTGVLLLLDECGDTGTLKQYDFRPLRRRLQRQIRQTDDSFPDTDSPQLGLPPAPAAEDSDPTRLMDAAQFHEASMPPPELPAARAADAEEMDPTRLMDVARLDETNMPPELPAVSAGQDSDPTRAFAAAPSTPDPTSPPPEPPIAPVAEEADPTRLLDAAPSVVEDALTHRRAAPELARAPLGPTTVLRGRYVLEEEIGRGGVGTVYRALDRNRAGLPHEQQYVALKVLRAEYAGRRDALHALRREFHQAQSLSHPGIVNVFDFDQDGDVHFVTMELLEGEPLGVLMRRALPHAVAHGVAIRILRELGEAIAYAHEREVLHLDLKPGNVMVTPQGRVRVLDFGLAQTFMAEPWISDMRPTAPPVTPAYASCQRLAGELPDARDDIFSFACLAYELLSGRHPFDRRSATVARIDGCTPRRISSLSRRQWRALKSALAWEREDRPASMQELLDAMALHRTTQPLRARSSVSALRPAAAIGLILLGAATALSWERWPDELRTVVGERVAATGDSVTQAAHTARLWLAERTALPAEDSAPAATAATGARTAGAAVAPQTEGASPPVTPPIEPAGPLPSPSATDAPAAGATTAEDAGEAPQLSELLVAAEPAAARPAATAPAPPAGGGPGVLEFTSDTFTVSESTSMARLSVRRRGGAAGEVSFSWRTVDDSAVAGEDYAPAQAREVMADGQTTATLLIPIVADSVAEHTKLFDAVIEDPSGARLGAVTRVPVIIVDDD